MSGTTLLGDPTLSKAVSSIRARSERQPEVALLERTFVDTGVLPQLENPNNQILYGRRGTGKSHLFRVLGAAHDRHHGHPGHVYLDMRFLGSAHLMSDIGVPIATRCIAVFRDLVSEVQNFLLDTATDPGSDAGVNALQAVSDLADALVQVSRAVGERQVMSEETAVEGEATKLKAEVSTKRVGIEAGGDDTSNVTSKRQETFTEVLRETVVFSEAAVGAGRVLVTLDTDFGELVARAGSHLPSIVLFRGAVTRRPDRQATLLLENLDQFETDLDAGAVVVIGDDRVRVRRLPIE